MALIGNPLNSVAFLTDSFNGNGSTTAFTMSVAPATSSSILVNITGVTQAPSTYSVVGTTLTFSTAPPVGTASISVRYLGIPASGVVTTAYRTLTEFTATASQTTFTPPSYTVGFIAVYQNGVRLGSADYTATNGTTVVLAVGALVGDLISTESFYVSSVLNALPVTGGTISGNLVVTGTASITGVTTLTGGLNTPLAVTSGGTGVATSTGSGANVLGTSPTLVTPILGTPTSGNLANCTGIPVPAALSTASGSAPSYSARAWVNFNGTGTVAIRASGNVSSITDNGTGDYTINFTTAMSDANYSAVGTAGSTGTGGDSQFFVWQKDTDNRTASSVRFVATQHGLAGGWGPNPTDVSQLNVNVFR
jgi:hypothetical protein